MTRASKRDLAARLVWLLMDKMLFPQPGNGFYSSWLWEEEMEGENTLLADTLLTLQRQQE